MNWRLHKMNSLIPFICLGIGAAISWRGLPDSILKVFDWIINIALVILMLVIGLNIGTSPEVMNNLGGIGISCVILSVAAILTSALFVRILEKTVLPLEETRKKFSGDNGDQNTKDSSFSPLIIIMPACIVIGIIVGWFVLHSVSETILDRILTFFFFFFYVGYIKSLGLKILFLPLAIFLGSITGGLIVGLLLRIPLNYAVISTSGMGYYSLTGAMMTDYYGIEAGTYGFIVNVTRDVFTIILMPLLLKISKGSPIAAGAAGCHPK